MEAGRAELVVAGVPGGLVHLGAAEGAAAGDGAGLGVVEDQAGDGAGGGHDTGGGTDAGDDGLRDEGEEASLGELHKGNGGDGSGGGEGNHFEGLGV